MTLTYRRSIDVHSVVSYYALPHIGLRMAVIEVSVPGYGLFAAAVRADQLTINGAEVTA